MNCDAKTVVILLCSVGALFTYSNHYLFKLSDAYGSDSVYKENETTLQAKNVLVKRTNASSPNGNISDRHPDTQLHKNNRVSKARTLFLSIERNTAGAHPNASTRGRNRINLDNGWLLELDANHNLRLDSGSLECEFYTTRIDGGGNGSGGGAVTVCNGDSVQGLLVVGGEVYTIYPRDDTVLKGSHVLIKEDVTVEEIKSIRNKRSTTSTSIFYNAFSYNLTGDTIDIGDGGRPFPDTPVSDEQWSDDNGDAFTPDVPESGAVKWSKQPMGYFLDTAWEMKSKRRRPLEKGSTNTGRHGGDAVHSPRWLEIAIVVDYSVVEFHGKDKVRQYVISLMNIVSAIYKDSSLNANLHLVLSRIILLTDKKDSQVRKGNAKRSLENVNHWNAKLNQRLHPRMRHDAAVWLTRLDIGGPSGYAPVAGVCDPTRSCALNRDEGLTSAFIVAHEMAHILGLTHDGDRKSGNSCAKDGSVSGTVMAPMVSATFLAFTWSQCSRAEFHHKVMKWTCLMDPPQTQNATVLESRVSTVFSMDDQCRAEFGDGYGLCRGFDIVEPCAHLWCGHLNTPLVCKTKKGPPLEGTECAFDKWCVGGYCEKVDTRRWPRSKSTEGTEPVLHNPMDGGWGYWSPWSRCSRTCGRGVSFRNRFCDNPMPAYGGADCNGKSEEFRICALARCARPAHDPRAQQCAVLQEILAEETLQPVSGLWTPYEPLQDSMKCQLTCSIQESGEIYHSGENVVDGAACTYENTNTVCIQGECKNIGCDGDFLSDKVEDLCGVCGGNNSECRNASSIIHKVIKKELNRIIVLPAQAHSINISVNSIKMSAFARIVIRDRDKYQHNLQVSTSGHSVIEGARFHLHKAIEDELRLYAKGPLLQDVLVLLQVPAEVVAQEPTLTIRYNYVLHVDDIAAAGRYQWVVAGWGPCSTSCGPGGRRQRSLACQDTQTGRTVSRRLCPLADKPAHDVESCNNISCSFTWIPGEWESCSVTCGSRGIQTRELYCVHQSALDAISISTTATTSNRSENDDRRLQILIHYAISPSICSSETKPVDIRTCNRYACPAFWVHSEWSQCSVTCGVGFSTREVYCPVPPGEPVFSCGMAPPAQRRACRGPYTRRTHPACHKNRRRSRKCRADLSQYCTLTDFFGRYCVIQGFKRLCCKSCTLNYLPD